MSADAAPARRQGSGRVPAHGQAEGEGVADDGACCGAQRGDRIGGGGVDDAGSDGEGRGVQEEVEGCGDF